MGIGNPSGVSMSIDEEEQIIENTTKCKECGSRNLTTDETRGEVSCEDYDLVIEENKIDPGAEWRVFSRNRRRFSKNRRTE